MIRYFDEWAESITDKVSIFEIGKFWLSNRLAV